MGNAERLAHEPLRAHIICANAGLLMRPSRTRKLVSLALGLGVLGCLWFYFAPVALGGSTSYVVTEGVSMEPRFHTGDLALVRRQSSYHVGEIAAYYSKEFHTIVLHRIVGRAGTRYVFKGDNNNFVDFEHPARSQLLGALWLHVPGVGATLESVRSPALIGGLTAVGTLLLAGGVFTRRRRRQRQRQARAGAGAGSTLTPVGAPQLSAGSLAGVLPLAALALVPFVVLALLAFTRAPSKRVAVAVPYEQSGTLSYTAHALPGPTYANDTAVTGEPLFTHVVSAAEMRFAYELRSQAKSTLAGELSLYAEVASSSGWKSTLELGSPVRFHGDRAVIAAPLDLTSLLALVHTVERMTAVGGSYTLTLLPRVSAGGSLGTLPLHAKFTPLIRFTLSPLELQPAVPASSSLGAGAPQGDQFTPSTPGSVTGKRSEALSLSFGVVRLAVATARAIALGGIAIVVLLALGMLAFVRPRDRDEAAAIRARYGRLIVPVARVSQLPGVAVIDVADMDALARIADHYDRSILYEEGVAGDAFWVTDESGQFRYTLRPSSSRASEGELAEAAPEYVPTAELVAVPAAEPAAPAPAPEYAPTAEFVAGPAPAPDGGFAPDGGIAPDAGFVAGSRFVPEAGPVLAARQPPAAEPASDDVLALADVATAADLYYEPAADDGMADEVYADELELGEAWWPQPRVAS